MDAVQQSQQAEVEGYGVLPFPRPVPSVFRLPVPPPPPPSGVVSGTEGYQGGSYSGSSDPGGVDFGDAPVIHLF
jgi:hypothetical protein